MDYCERIRAEFALSFIEPQDGPADAGVEEAWRVEIDQREAEVERGEVRPSPVDEVFERLRRRLNGDPPRLGRLPSPRDPASQAPDLPGRF